MSWSRQQQQSFAAQGAALRRQTSGDPDCQYEGRSLCVTHSAVRDHRVPVEGGFEVIPAFVGRVDMCAYPWFTPRKGSILKIGKTPYMITEVARVLHGGEWVFALGPA